MLLRIQGQGHPGFSPVLQAMLTGLDRPQPSLGLHGRSHVARAQPWDDPIERGLIGAPRCLQAWPTFYGVVSTMKNDRHSRVSIYRQQQLPVSARSPRRAAHRSRESRRQWSQRDSLYRYEGRPGQGTHRAVVPPRLLPIHQADHLRNRNRPDSDSHWPSTLGSPRRLLVPTYSTWNGGNGNQPALRELFSAPEFDNGKAPGHS